MKKAKIISLANCILPFHVFRGDQSRKSKFRKALICRPANDDGKIRKKSENSKHLSYDQQITIKLANHLLFIVIAFHRESAVN